MLPILIICPGCMKEFEADPLVLEYHCPRCVRCSTRERIPLDSPRR